MENNIINTLDDGDRVTSTYAEIYFNDDHCDYKRASTAGTDIGNESNTGHDEDDAPWVSPSDLLIGKVDLKPPFTSKITRGKAHEGLLGIGNEVLARERAKFLQKLTILIHENDSAWSHILEHEKTKVSNRVQEIYGKILMDKSKIMNQEISTFYETSLQELELHLKSDLNNVLISTHASIISKLNTDIQQKLKKERKITEDLLKKRYKSEVAKIRTYYKLLLNNELQKNKSLINQAVTERNDTLKAFYRQIEAENMTSTMYIMCTERKKCKINQFFMENYQSLELTEKYQKIKEREDIINVFKEKDMRISEINKEWEEKVKSVLQLFLKFISFSLKLLPEQSTFLLDFEKMVVLQLNEIIKMPDKAPSILVEEENIFKFENPEVENDDCTNEPFVTVGDLSDPVPPQYGSRETLPLDVDLPTIRLQRQFIYAKCHKYEEIKAMLESKGCKCLDFPLKQQTPSVSNKSEPSIQESGISIEAESSNELLLGEDFDINRLKQCPARNCKHWAKRFSFPNLDSYLDFDEEKFKRVVAIMGKPSYKGVTPQLINPKDITYTELKFSATNEPHHTVETQYSSQADLTLPECPCLEDFLPLKQKESSQKVKGRKASLNEILAKRKISLRRILQQNPNLLKMFTDEAFDFQV